MRTSSQLLLALLLWSLVVAPALPPARAQGPAGLSDAPPPAPPAFAAPEPAPPSPQQSLVCAQILADPAVSEPPADSPWRELRNDRDFADDQFVSSPQSMRMAEDEDSYREDYGDVDAFGQGFAVSEDTDLLYGSLRYRVSGAPAPGEQIEVAIYLGDSLGSGGPVAAFGAATAGELNGWRRLDWEIAEPGLMADLVDAGRVLIAVSLRSRDGGNQTVWVDDIRANSCATAAALVGRVTSGDSPTAGLAGARLLLVRSDATGERVIAAASSDAAGDYRFEGVPPLAGGAAYRVWFVNVPGGEGRAAFWAGPRITALGEGEREELPAFDIGDIPLLAPPSYSGLAIGPGRPVTLSWAARGAPGERYQLCLYDPDRLDPQTGRPPQLCSGRLSPPASGQLSYSLTVESLEAAPGLGFAYGRSYRWYVAALKLGAGGELEQYGYSRYEHAITLTRQEAPPPSAPSADEPGLPGAPAAEGDWTVMVYAAGDNGLSDPRRGPGISRVEAQLARLADLAPAYNGVRIVTYADLYGDTGAGLCYLRPVGGPDCRRRAEPDSADPATLEAFVAAALEQYPARRAMLLLIGPGHAVAGFGPDETSPGAPAMPLDGVARAVAAASEAAGRPVDLIAFQAPLIGELGAARALAGSASYMLAASDQSWQLAWLERVLPLLSGASKDDPRAVAIGAVAAYRAAVGALAPGRAVSMAAYDLGRATAAQQALDQLGEALGEALRRDPTGTLALLAEARATAQRYDSSGNGRLGEVIDPTGGATAGDDDAFFDAAELAAFIAGSPLASAEAAAAASALAAVVAGPTPLVLAAEQRSGIGVAGATVRLDRAVGLAVFLPAPTALGGQRTLAEIALGPGGRGGGWAALLRDYLASAPPSGPGGVSAGPAGGVRFAPPTGGTIGVSLWLPVVARLAPPEGRTPRRCEEGYGRGRPQRCGRPVTVGPRVASRPPAGAGCAPDRTGYGGLRRSTKKVKLRSR